jgi:hypothetical protein
MGRCSWLVERFDEEADGLAAHRLARNPKAGPVLGRSGDGGIVAQHRDGEIVGDS